MGAGRPLCRLPGPPVRLSDAHASGGDDPGGDETVTLRFIEQRARLPRLGIIRLGIKTLSAGGKEIPREVDYFVLPEDLVGLFDGRPKKLPVMFPFDEVDHVLQAAYEKRSGPTLSLRCNSQFYTTWDERGKASTGPCRKAEVEDAVPCPCGAVVPRGTP